MENNSKKQKRILIISGAVLLALVLAFSLISAGSKAQPVTGEKAFSLTVVHGNGSNVQMKLTSDAETLGEALTALNVISGEAGDYGMYVTSVDGETADDAQQQWWCLTKNGEMWMNGVDATVLEDGDAYEFTLTTGYDWE